MRLKSETITNMIKGLLKRNYFMNFINLDLQLISLDL